VSRPSRDPSIEHEPQMRPGGFATDPTEPKAERQLASEARRANIDEYVEQTVWDEPALSRELVGPDDGQRLTYAEWLDWRIATTPAARTWLVTLAVVVAAGPWGVVGALLESVAIGTWGWIVVATIAPVAEEMMKIAVVLWIAEKRPYLFRTAFQILLCALAGGLAFALIENLMYLHVYFPRGMEAQGHPQAEAARAVALADLATWRWTVCTALHVTCSFLAGLGVVRMWSYAMVHRTRPQVAHAAPLIVTAMICHGLYNTAVTIAEMVGWAP
jgi:hypothetical protein